MTEDAWSRASGAWRLRQLLHGRPRRGWQKQQRVSGVILADQVKCLDWRSRRAALVTRLPDDVLEDLLLRLGVLLAVPD